MTVKFLVGTMKAMTWDQKLTFVFALLLASCSVKHIPKTYAPYFSKGPERRFRPAMIERQKKLELKSDLSFWEKRKLRSLYVAEKTELDPKTERYQWLDQKIESMTLDDKAYIDKITHVDRDYRKRTSHGSESNYKPHKPEHSSGNPYEQAYSLWNDNENIDAAKVIDAGLSNLSFLERGSREELIQLYYLRLRVAVDNSDLPLVEASYLKLRELERCGYETVSGGFLLSLHFLWQGSPKKARLVYSQLCDVDEVMGSYNLSLYWRGRIESALGAAKPDAWVQLAKQPIPSFYSMMARKKMGMAPITEIPSSKKIYLSTPLEVSSTVDELWGLAEQALTSELRRDAAVFSRESSRQLLEDLNEKKLLPALYSAHLLQASGEHLDAMKVYGAITEYINREGVAHPESLSFVEEMYPKAHEREILWNCRLWKEDPNFVYAIIRQESAFVPMATSRVNAKGLMQLMPFLGEELASDWGYGKYYKSSYLYNSEENLKLAIFHIHQLRSLVSHPVLVAAAYNAGLRRAARWWERFGQAPIDIFIELIPVAETQKYVKLIGRNLHYYSKIRDGAFDPDLFPAELPPYNLKKSAR